MAEIIVDLSLERAFCNNTATFNIKASNNLDAAITINSLRGFAFQGCNANTLRNTGIQEIDYSTANAACNGGKVYATLPPGNPTTSTTPGTPVNYGSNSYTVPGGTKANTVSTFNQEIGLPQGLFGSAPLLFNMELAGEGTYTGASGLDVFTNIETTVGRNDGTGYTISSLNYNQPKCVESCGGLS